MNKESLIDTLKRWQREGIPDFEGEGLVAPNEKVIDFAIKLAECYDLDDFPRGTIPSVVPDGEGGIVFELWHNQKIDETIRIGSDLSKELTKFKNNKVIGRYKL